MYLIVSAAEDVWCCFRHPHFGTALLVINTLQKMKGRVIADESERVTRFMSERQKLMIIFNVKKGALVALSALSLPPDSALSLGPFPASCICSLGLLPARDARLQLHGHSVPLTCLRREAACLPACLLGQGLAKGSRSWWVPRCCRFKDEGAPPSHAQGLKQTIAQAALGWARPWS